MKQNDIIEQIKIREALSHLKDTPMLLTLLFKTIKDDKECGEDLKKMAAEADNDVTRAVDDFIGKTRLTM